MPTMAKAHPIMDNSIRAAMFPFRRESGRTVQQMDFLGFRLWSTVILER
jgi:hypothetical protein